MSQSELHSEQAYIDHAYACLERTRRLVGESLNIYDSDAGGTHQARLERDVATERARQRLAQLDLGDQSLCFGRLDFEQDDDPYYIGRIAVANERAESVVVDWRAPIAEAFYRATGNEPMGLRRRRHFASQGPTLRGIDDELFGSTRANLDRSSIQGEGALIAALEEARTGTLTDIVATIQGEQDKVIRAPLSGVLVVQGGPGTGKTVVALHRAAYLLYTHRFPLEGQGVLVLGPNRLFLSYIEQVLPSLGEAGVQIAMLADLVHDVTIRGTDPPKVALIKGDLRMVPLIKKAVRDRQRSPRRTIVVPFGIANLRVTPAECDQIIASARRKARFHNAGRKFVEQSFFELLASKTREGLDPHIVRDRTRHLPEVREALERMWPLLTPAQLLNDLFGSPGLLKLAGTKYFNEAELALLRRERESHSETVIWSTADAPLLDEAFESLGPRPRERHDLVRTYGHIVIDEAQDLSPMELRMVDRRSLNGSLTVVGDIAQATGAFAHESWDSVRKHLPNRRPPQHAELVVGYRVPGPAMRLASKVLALAAPMLSPPRSVREIGDEPTIEVTTAANLGESLAAAIHRERLAVGAGSIGIIVPSARIQRVEELLFEHHIDAGSSTRGRLDHQISVVAVGMCKGLELDSVIVVDPESILTLEHRGPQALYVALTRATKRLSVLAVDRLPSILA